MSNIKKGGIATVITVIIMVGIVLALIISSVIPTAQEGQKTAQAGVGMLQGLQTSMGA